MDQQEYSSQITTLQATVRTEIALIGGYYPVPSAQFLVHEKFGEACRARSEHKSSEYVKHLFEVFWFLTCIGNQYCADLAFISQSVWPIGEADDKAPEENDVILDLSVNLGHVSKIVNLYECDHSSSNPEALESISVYICRCHAAICSEFKRLEVDFTKLQDDRLEVVRHSRRDPHIPHEPRFDPTMGVSIDKFSKVMETTLCPFAAHAKTWATRPWRTEEDIRAFIAKNEETFRRFSRVQLPEQLDALVVEAPSVENISELTRKTGQILKELGAYSSNNPMSSAITRREWRFRLFDTEVFVSVFSSIYEDSHPRSSKNRDSTFFVFQPLSSFKAKPGRDKLHIRKLFSDSGQSYELGLEGVRFEAQKYIKPINVNDTQPVCWWNKWPS